MSSRVGLLTVDLCVTDAMTLKDKRQVIRSILDRTRNRFNVAVAETDRNETRRRAQLAFASVSNDGKHIEQVMARVLAAVERDRRIVVEDSSIEVL